MNGRDPRAARPQRTTSHRCGHLVGAAVAAALAVAAGACGSSSTSLTGPSATKCAVTVSGPPGTVPASGGAGTITVSTTRDCTWAASSSNNWIVITSPSSGQGDGTVAYRVAANTDHNARRGTLAINDQQMGIAQDAAACQYSLDPISSTVPASGGSVTVRVNADGPCGWTVASNASWVTVASAPSGSGAGTVTVNVASNDGAARTGTLTIAGQTFTVAQSGSAPDCSASLAPASQNVAATGGNGTLTLTIGRACSWTATSTADWVTITGRSAGTGPAQVTFAVAANPNPTGRRASIAVAGETFTVSQDGVACAYAIAPVSQTVAASGGSVTVSVTAATGCGWSATSGVSWISITSGANGTGNGTVVLNVAATSGGSRTGTVTIAGQAFTVTQAAPSCSYAISPSAQALPATGGTGAVAVSAGSACGWTAAANDTWITVTSGGSGTGNGNVAYVVAPNTGAARTGTLTIAGQTFTVTQAALACTFTIAPTSASVPASGGSGTVTVTGGGSCAWTATANDAWITIASGNTGTGSGSVAYAVAPNSGAARTGTMTIAGQTFTVSQAAASAPCSYSIAPTSQPVPATGGPASVSVSTSDLSCAWTAVSNAPWITVTGGATGTGPGTVALNIDPNAGPARTGTVTVAGQTVTVSQAAPCSYSIAPTNQGFPSAGGNGSVSVTASDASCGWTAVSNAAWITITSAGAGSGTGGITFAVAPNSGPDRTGTMTIAGQTFTVTQTQVP